MLDLVLLGLIISAEPLPLIGFILVLSTKRGLRNGAAFIAGWIACLLVVIVATLLLTGGSPPKRSSSPGTAILVGKLLFGLVLVGFGLVRWLRRSAPQADKPEPAWMHRVDQLRPAGAAWLGVLLQPWPLVVAGAAIILDADLAQLSTVVSLVGFVALSTWSFAAMEVLFLRNPDPTRERLGRLRSWLNVHRGALVSALAVVVGAWLGLTAAIDLV